MAILRTFGYDLELHFASLDNMSDDELLNFCLQNKQIPIERDEKHQLLFLSLTPTEYSRKKAELNGYVGMWNRKLKTGLTFDSSAGFFLPDTSMRSPDAAWISNERWNALTEDQRKGFAYITPDFVVELTSPTDSLAQLKLKMEKWRENGVRLGWLIDTKTETVFIYRANGTISKVEGFDNVLSGEDVLPGFEFNLSVLRS